MCSQSTYQHMLAALRAKIDAGYSPEAAHQAIEQDWAPERPISCELYADALDYQLFTYGSD